MKSYIFNVPTEHGQLFPCDSSCSAMLCYAPGNDFSPVANEQMSDSHTSTATWYLQLGEINMILNGRTRPKIMQAHLYPKWLPSKSQSVCHSQFWQRPSTKWISKTEYIITHKIWQDALSCSSSTMKHLCEEPGFQGCHLGTFHNTELTRV